MPLYKEILSVLQSSFQFRQNKLLTGKHGVLIYSLGLQIKDVQKHLSIHGDYNYQF